MTLQTTTSSTQPAVSIETSDLPRSPATSSVVRLTQELQSHLRDLAALPESDAPLISCYLDLELGRNRWQSLLKRRTKLLRRLTPASGLESLDASVDRIRTFMRSELRPETLGVAAFARVGSDPYFRGLQFEVPTPTWISLDTVPNIYHLIGLKDTFDRYLVLISTSDSTRIFEVRVGAMTSELWLRQPELRRRVGREWTRLRYQNHHRDRDRGLIREMIQTLERLMMGRGYAHLILAGEPQRLAMIRRELPGKIREKVVDVVAVPAGLTDKEVVKATLASFVQEEEHESRSLAQLLLHELRSDGLAVPGAANSLQMLRRGQADALVLATDWERHDAREELVRLAEQTGCHIDFVGKSHALDKLGGVGCLLRFSERDIPAYGLPPLASIS